VSSSLLHVLLHFNIINSGKTANIWLIDRITCTFFSRQIYGMFTYVSSPPSNT